MASNDTGGGSGTSTAIPQQHTPVTPAPKKKKAKKTTRKSQGKPR